MNRTTYRGATLLAALTLATGTAACTTPAADASTSSTSTSTTTASTTSAGTTQGDPDPDTAAVPTDAEEYADAWVRAWGRGDDATLETLSSTDALQQAKDNPGDSHWDFDHADSGAGTYHATYTNSQDGRHLTLAVELAAATAGEEHAVRDLELTGADQVIPTDAEAYANAWVRAWGRGDDPTLETLSATDALQAGRGTPGDAHWSYDGGEAGAGSLHASYVNDEDGRTLDLTVDLSVASVGGEHAVTEVTFGEG